jgi:hypothetical protein
MQHTLLDSASHMGMGVVKQYYTLHENARTLPLDYNSKALENSAVVL